MNRAAAGADAIVLVPVPRRHLIGVYKYLARLADSREAPRDNSVRPWTSDELRWLRQLLTNRPVALALLDLTADLDGEPLTFAELCEVTGETRQKARGELASLTSVVRKAFHRDQSPMDVHWESEGLCYRMRPEIAVLWSDTDVSQ